MAESHFRNLQVYRIAFRVSAFLYQITRRVPSDARPIVRQLIRAATSLVLNIAEGAGEYRPLEKARFYRIARRSSWETSAALDMLRIIKAVPADQVDRAQAALDRIGAMLTTMAKNFEAAVVSGTWPAPAPPTTTTRSPTATPAPSGAAGARPTETHEATAERDDRP
jgi:four helix bundle protein